MNFQDLILSLQRYWGERGCAILQPFDMEMGAGTFHPATFLRSIGPKPWRAAYVQPCRRPGDARYGDNPNRLGHYYQFQVIIKPSPLDIQEMYLGSLEAIGIDLKKHDTRFVERLAMYLQGVDNVFDLTWVDGITYRDVYHQNEVEQSKYNFEHADTDLLLRMFEGAKEESTKLSGEMLCLPAYDQAMKCSHLFNLLDARGAISVAERAQYIGRIRTLALRCAQVWQGINPDEEAAK